MHNAATLVCESHRTCSNIVLRPFSHRSLSETTFAFCVWSTVFIEFTRKRTGIDSFAIIIERRENKTVASRVQHKYNTRCYMFSIYSHEARDTIIYFLGIVLIDTLIYRYLDVPSLWLICVRASLLFITIMRSLLIFVNYFADRSFRI